jgi:hypothetical protein
MLLTVQTLQAAGWPTDTERVSVDKAGSNPRGIGRSNTLWSVKKLADLADGPFLCTCGGKGRAGKQTTKQRAIAQGISFQPSA